MTSVRAALRKPVITTDTAERVGDIQHVLVDPESHAAVAVQVSGGKHGRFVSWRDIAAFGDDALMVESRDVLRAAQTDLERRALNGRTTLLEKRVLTDRGDDRGSISDIRFDEKTGQLGPLEIGSEQIDAGSLLGIGSYAVVIRSPDQDDESPQ